MRIKAQRENHFLLARQAIIWLVHAHRPLKISEFRHALGVQLGAEIFDEYDIANEDTILLVCCGLIVVDRESQIVGFVRECIFDYC